MILKTSTTVEKCRAAINCQWCSEWVILEKSNFEMWQHEKGKAQPGFVLGPSPTNLTHQHFINSRDPTPVKVHSLISFRSFHFPPPLPVFFISFIMSDQSTDLPAAAAGNINFTFSISHSCHHFNFFFNPSNFINYYFTSNSKSLSNWLKPRSKLYCCFFLVALSAEDRAGLVNALKVSF